MANGGIGNMGKMMKQLQKAQSGMARLQEELAERTVQNTSGGGAVQVTVNGRKEILTISIDPEVLNGENREMLEDLLLVAINGALQEVDRMVNTEMHKFTGSINLPPGLF